MKAKGLYGALMVVALFSGWYSVNAALIWIVIAVLLVQLALNLYGLPRRSAWLPNLNFLAHRIQVTLTLAASGAGNGPLIIVIYMFLVSSLVWYRDAKSVIVQLLSYQFCLWLGSLLSFNLGFAVTLNYTLMHSLGLTVIAWLMAVPIIKLDNQASRDPLTGLLNRRAGLSELERLIRAGKPLALMFVDIEGFKAINDTHGHAIGDEALVWVAAKLIEHTRDTDTVLRYGGDEFVIATSGPSDVLQQRLETALNFGLRGGAIAVTLSWGVAQFPRDARTLEALLEVADRAMYAHKRREV